MAPSSIPLVRLSEMEPDQEGDLFVLLTAKEELLTRDGKPYFKVTFRDAWREVSFPIWENSPLAAECRGQWTPGTFYKVRATYRQTTYGPQLDIRKIREVTAARPAISVNDSSAWSQNSLFPPKPRSLIIDSAKSRP